MNERRSYDMVIGSFVALGLVVLVVLIFLIGKERRLFDRTVSFKAHFPNVAGLAVGADVLLSGRVVGRVKAIEFPVLDVKHQAKDMAVRMEISHEYTHWIRSDSIAYIDTKGLLGDKLVNITMGSALFEQVPEGGLLKSTPPLDYSRTMEKVQSTIDGISDVVNDLKKALAQEDGSTSLAQSFKSLRKILNEIETGNGLIHELIYDQKTAQSTKASVEDLRGALKAFTNVSNEVTIVFKDIKTGSGIAHDLIYSENQSQILTSLNKAAIDLEIILRDLKNGKGSLGLLLQDRSIYDELFRFIGDLNRNRLLKAVIRHGISNSQKAKQ
jgi:phospholipid/cholesterol/gamma-HCH transport system substrate-binding protein